MPFIPNAPDDQEQQPGQGAIAPGGAGGIRTSPGGIGSAPAVSSAPAPKDAGGNFATLQSYLTANQGQAEPLAGKITSGIGQQYNTLSGQNASTLSGINSQVTNAPGYTASNPDVLAQEAANPVSFSSDTGNVKNFQNLLNNTYGGPATAEGTSDFQKQQAVVNNAIATGQNATQTEAGRENLLTQNEARPTTGVTALNSAILTQDPNSLNKVETAYQPFSNLVNQLSTGAQGIDTTIGKEQADAAASNAAANKQIADQTAALQTGVQSNLSNAQNEVNQYNAGLGQWQTGVAANQPFNAALQASGLLPLLGVSNPFTGNYSALNAPTLAQTATPEQLATDQALAKLAGSTYTPVLSPDQASQVGTFQAPGALPTAPNIAALMDQIASAERGNVPTGGNQSIKDLSDSLYLEGLAGQGAPGTGGILNGVPTGNIQNQIVPFKTLLDQLNQIYGTQYVTKNQITPGLSAYDLNS